MTYWPQEKLRSDQRNRIVNIINKIRIVLKRKNLLPVQFIYFLRSKIITLTIQVIQ